MTLISSLTELLSASGDAAYDWDLHGDQMRWYGAYEKLFGMAALPPATAESFFNIIHPDDRHLIFGVEEQMLDRQYRLRDLEGVLVWVHERGTVESENGRIVRQRGILRVIQKPDHVAVQQDLQGQDKLTGCHSRTYMLAQIDKALEAAKLAGRTAAYLVLGIDKMSFVNEAVGMEAGDALLRGVAERLSQIIPHRAVLGRVGGDLFGVLLPEPLGSDLPVLAERLVQSFRDHPVVTRVTPLHITVSLGAVRLPTVSRNATEVMIFAEQALHDAHARGRNLFVEYADSPQRTQDNRLLLQLGERIKHAFKNDGFRLAYQPIIDAASGDVESYEALVRMFGDDGQPIPAALFVPAIEQLGLAFELDRRVLDMAVMELDAYPDLRLAINVSGLTASQADWPDYVKQVLTDRPDSARRLVVEITETAAIVDVGETKRFVDQLRALGGQVSLDDFGAGFTSIRHLRSLSLSIMKIDKDLLHNVMIHPEQQHLVRMLIELARGLGLKTVAEGVETEDVAAWLRKAKVDLMQGYYFGKPMLGRPWLTGQSDESLKKAMPVQAPAITKTDLKTEPMIFSVH